MKRLSFCTAIAALLLGPALAWAGGDCCGQNRTATLSEASYTNGNGHYTHTAYANGCDTCKKPKCGFCAWLCGKCKKKCNGCGAQMVKREVQCCRERTTYKLVRQCEPVCRQRTVSHRDPCDPCKVTRTVVNEWSNRTRYRWVAETKPVCHTKTVRVCAASCDTVNGHAYPASAFGGSRGTVQTLASTVR
jgi:hypothetical protein